jgi:hypothetical protein
VPEVVRNDVRFARSDHLGKRPKHGVLDGAAADRTDRRSVGLQNEPRAGLLRRRPNGADDRRKGAALPTVDQLEQGLNDFAHRVLPFDESA